MGLQRLRSGAFRCTHAEHDHLMNTTHSGH